MEKELQKYSKVLDSLKRLCSRREYCTSEIMKKALYATEGNHEAASSIVDILVDERYVDDLRYASAFARDKSSIAGWGEVKIRYMLSAKGISKEKIVMALAEIDNDKAEGRMGRLLENKWKTLKDDPQGKQKLIRFAIGRGYGYDEVVALVNKIVFPSIS